MRPGGQTSPAPVVVELNTTMGFALLYACFAALATGANILVQDSVLRVYSGDFMIPVSMLFGTAAGLLLKFVLDKRYIFGLRTSRATHDGRLFALYAATGVVTTAIFWGMELLAEFLFHERLARYAGAVIGLGIGYTLKYHLDRRFVFKPELT